MGIISRILVLALGYAYPSYECYKTVELNKPEIEQLRFWCQYWILVALIAVVERFTDPFISWLPMYGEAKLAFYIYLWYPKSRGAVYVYETLVKPFISKHENTIDENILELRTRTGDLVMLNFQKFAKYGQSTFFEILNYVVTQSQSAKLRPQRKQNQQSEQVDPAAPGNRGAVSQTRSFRSTSVKKVEKVKKSGDSESEEEVQVYATDSESNEETTQDESTVEDSIRAARNRLRKRPSSIGVGTSST